MSSKKRKVSVSVENQTGQSLPACYFPSGLNPSSKDGDASNLSIDVKVKKVKNATNFKVVANKGDVTFSADSAYLSADTDTAAGSACSYAVAVYDKDTGKVTLAPLAGNRVLRLEPRISGLAYEPTRNGASETSAEMQANKLANKKLVDEFGSTRRRRQLSAREEGIVRAEKLSGSGAVEQMLIDVAALAAGQGLTKTEVLQRSTETRMVPPHNPEATTAFEAYPMRLLLPSLAHGGQSEGFLLETKRLIQAAESDAAAQALRERRVVHPYVLSRLVQLRAGDAAVVARRAKYLGLLSALLTLESRRFLKVFPVSLAPAPAPAPVEGDEAAAAADGDGVEGSAAPQPTGGMDGLARQLKVRPALLEDLLSLFYERSTSAPPTAGIPEGLADEDDVSSSAAGAVSYERPDAKKNLLMLYILTCALLAEDGAMGYQQFEALKQALKLGPSNLVMYFTEIGAVPKGKSVKLDSESPLAQANGGLTRLNSYTVNLLNDPNHPEKTLRESFPAIKLSKKAGGR